MGARVGFVSSYNATEGTAAVHYPDRLNEVTDQLPVLAPFGVKQVLKKGQMVLVIHLDNASEAGVVIGGIDCGAAAIDGAGGSLRFSDNAGAVTVSEIIQDINSR